MSFYEDFLLINKGCLEKSINSMSKNWIIIFTGIVYSIIDILIYSIIARIFRGPLSLIAGIIAGFATAAMTSNYLYLLYNIIFYDKITMDDFKEGFGFFLGKVYSVLVLAWIARYFLNVFGVISATGAFTIGSLATLVIMIVLNALPETLYQKHYGGMDNVIYTVNFIKDNILNWFIPNIILSLVLYLVSGQFMTSLFMNKISIGFNFMNPIMFIRYLLGQAIFSFMMIYRGHLFNLLSTSTKRKREFMRNF